MSWWNPSDEEKEKVRAIGVELTNEIKNEIRRRRLNALSVNLVGSTAINTFIKGDFDFDVFVVAPTEKDCSKIRQAFRLLHPLGHEKGGPLRAWETKFVTPTYADDVFEVDEICITPDHDRFATIQHAKIYGNLPSEQRQEIRRMKAVLKSHGIYGAEHGGFSSIAISESIRTYKSVDAFCDMFEKDGIIPRLEDPTQKGRDVFGSIRSHPQTWIDKVKQKMHRACNEGILDHPYSREDFIEDNTMNKIISLHCPSKDKITSFTSALHACTASINAIGHGVISDPRCDVFVKGDECLIAFGFDVKDRKIGPPAIMEKESKIFQKEHPSAMLDLEENRWYVPIEVDKNLLERKMMARITERMSEVFK